MPINRTQWSSPVADVEARLRKLDTVLRQAQRPDGSVDMAQAKKLAGKDLYTSELLATVRIDRSSPVLSPATAKRAFLDLQTAIATAADHDLNGDGSLGFEELPYVHSDDAARNLISRAALPTNLSLSERPTPRAWISLDARREAEAVITKTAAHHAETALGAEAIKWSMRADVSKGIDIKTPMIFDVVNYTETNWKASIPFFGTKYREGKGHLSDAELKVRFGPDLQAFIDKTKAEVNSRLMMDYSTEFLTGKDLP